MFSNSRLRFGAGCVALFVAIGCSAADNSGGGGFRPPSGSGLSGAGTGAAAVGAGAFAGTGASNGFGNSTVMPMIIGDPNAAMTKCKSPTVAFVVDGSGSMCEPFGGSGSRWQVLRTALIDKTQGLIYMLQDRGSFGLFIYDGAIDASLLTMGAGGGMQTCNSPGTFQRLNSMTCLGMVQVPAARNNAMKIDMAFPRTELGGSTPTDKAMKQQVDALIAAQVPPWDPVNEPQYIILATDGAPNDICPGGAGGDGTVQQMNVIAEVDRAVQNHITVFVISMAGGDMALEAHLQVVAMHGDPANPAAHSFSPMNSADLVSTIKMLLGQAFGCSIG